MLPIVALVFAVAVFLLSAGTITWLYIRLFGKMCYDDHKGSYKPYEVERLNLGKSARLFNSSAKVAASDEIDPDDVEAGRETTAGSGVTLLSVKPRRPEGESVQHGSTTQFDQSKFVADGCPSGNHPITSTAADGVSTWHSERPRTQSMLSYDPTLESEAKIKNGPPETPCTRLPLCQATCLNETATNDTVLTMTAVAHHGKSGNDSEELSLSPMLWDYAGVKWPGKNRQDVFTTDEDGPTDSDYSGTNDDEEDSDDHSSTSGVRCGPRKTQRSYSCYPFVEHGPEQFQNHRRVELLHPECGVMHCGAASSGSLVLSEDEADQAFYGKAQHDETYRQYLESIILQRKARMYYGPYGHYSQS